MSPPVLVARSSVASAASEHDALVLVAPAPLVEHAAEAGTGAEALWRFAEVDRTFGRAGRPPVLVPADVCGRRLVVAATSTLGDEIDDVRAVYEAARDATARAVDAGAKRPLVHVVAAGDARFARAKEVAALGALASQWAPLEAREAGRAPAAAEAIGVVGLDDAAAALVSALELGRSLARDITGTEPERMAPRRAAAFCEEAFAGTGVRVSVEHDVRAYPLLGAVARASQAVERHRPAVVRLEYEPEGEVTRTLVLVGKGVTYDTGGADLKVEGAMAGMSRDKGGAGAVAGVLRSVAALRPKGVRVVGLLGFVRNSIGEEGFVTDEVIVAHSGVRVRIGNTDAEGRLLLADLLSVARGLAAHAPNPFVASVATLTGHVYRAFGPYTGAIGNAAARPHLDRLGEHGLAWGELLERSHPRREDYAMVVPRSSAEDVVSANRLPSVSTPRGHQFPFAFLDIASGMRGTGIPFGHLDIGGSAVDPADWQFGKPTGFPVASLTALALG
jgi:leucyl aminopeptidase